MPDDVDGSARIRIELDDSGVPAEARALGDRIASAINGQINGIGRSIERQPRTVRINVQVSPDLARFEAELLAGLGHIDSFNVPVSPDLARFDAQLLAGLRGLDSINVPLAPDVTGFADRVRAALAGLEVSVGVAPDLTGFDGRIRAHHAPPVNVPVTADVSLLQCGLSSLSGTGSELWTAFRHALGIGSLTEALIRAAPAAASFLTSLAPTAGIVAALPAAVLGGAAAIGALQLALVGVSDAFGAALGDDEKKFDKALQDLSPHAAAAAKELRGLKPQFDALKNSVQDALFAPLVGQLTAVAKALGGPLKAGLSGIAAQFRVAGRSVAQFLASATGVKAIQQVLDATRTSVAALASGIDLAAGRPLEPRRTRAMTTRRLDHGPAPAGLSHAVAAASCAVPAWPSQSRTAAGQGGRDLTGRASGSASAGWPVSECARSPGAGSPRPRRAVQDTSGSRPRARWPASRRCCAGHATKWRSPMGAWTRSTEGSRGGSWPASGWRDTSRLRPWRSLIRKGRRPAPAVPG